MRNPNKSIKQRLRSSRISILTVSLIAAISILPLPAFAEGVTDDYGNLANYGYDQNYYQEPAPSGYSEPEAAAAPLPEEPVNEVQTEQETGSVVLKEQEADIAMPTDISGKIHVFPMMSGEGTAVLVESNGHYALINTGNAESAELIRTQMWDAGVTSLDLLIITGNDPGLTGGADLLLDSFLVNKLIIKVGSSEEGIINQVISQKAQEAGAEVVQNIPEGYGETLGRFHLTFVNCREKPESSYAVFLVDDYENKAFIAANLSNAGSDGDETKVLQGYPDITSIDFHVVGHYGHYDASSYAFVQYLDPACCIVPAEKMEFIDNYDDTRADRSDSFYYASGMAVTGIMGDVLVVECRTLDGNVGYYRVRKTFEDPALDETMMNVLPGERNADEWTAPPAAEEGAEIEGADQSEAEGVISTGLPEAQEIPSSEEQMEGPVNTGTDNARIQEDLTAETQTLEQTFQEEDPDAAETPAQEATREKKDETSDLENQAAVQEEQLTQETGTLQEETVPETTPQETAYTEPETSEAKTNTDPSRQYFTVTFETSGRGSAPDPQLVEAGKAAKDPGSVESEGVVFAGWFSDKALQNYYSFNTPVTEDMTLYARWTINSYIISFDPNQGTGIMEPQQISYGAEAELKANSFFREGFTFAGWCTDPDGNGTWYEDRGQIYSLTSENGKEIVLYAQWKEQDQVLYGNGQRVDLRNGDALEFKLTGTGEDLDSVVLDGRVLDPVEYALWETPELNVRIADETAMRLSDGEHSISFRFTGYSLNASFIICSGAVRTGDETIAWPWLSAFLASIVAATAAISIIRKNRRRNNG